MIKYCKKGEYANLLLVNVKSLGKNNVNEAHGTLSGKGPIDNLRLEILKMIRYVKAGLECPDCKSMLHNDLIDKITVCLQCKKQVIPKSMKNG